MSDFRATEILLPVGHELEDSQLVAPFIEYAGQEAGGSRYLYRLRIDAPPDTYIEEWPGVERLIKYVEHVINGHEQATETRELLRSLARKIIVSDKVFGLG